MVEYTMLSILNGTQLSLINYKTALINSKLYNEFDIAQPCADSSRATV